MRINLVVHKEEELVELLYINKDGSETTLLPFELLKSAVVEYNTYNSSQMSELKSVDIIIKSYVEPLRVNNSHATDGEAYEFRKLYDNLKSLIKQIRMGSFNMVLPIGD